MASKQQSLTSKELAAIRKVIYSLGDPQEQGLDVLEAADAAVQRVLEIEEAAQNAETTAQSAIGVAQNRQRADGGETTKKERVETICRNELVRRLAVDTTGAAGSHLTVRTVKDMCRPELTVYQQTVEDAWDELVARWRCFERGANEDGKKALKIDRKAVTEELVGAVEHDLDRDDLSKRLLRRGGGSG